MILKIVIVCGFRLGNLKYQKLYNSFGISNIFKSQKFCGLLFSLMHLAKSLRGLYQKLLWICVNPQELLEKAGVQF